MNREHLLEFPNHLYNYAISIINNTSHTTYTHLQSSHTHTRFPLRRIHRPKLQKTIWHRSHVPQISKLCNDSQVFSGVMRYEEFLKILTKTMFSILSGTTNRNDGTLYHIFSYLILFRLDELPYNEFKKMVTE